jgi:hypothetical protein
MARKPEDKQYGKHSFKGVRYDKNGNPIYTSDTLSDDEKKSMGWRYSKKHGLHGQISDPSKLQTESKQIIRLTESELKRIITESVKNVLRESRDDKFYYDLEEEMITSRNFVYDKYSQLSKNGTITLSQLDGALQSLATTMLTSACNLHDKLPASYGHNSTDYERFGY